MNIRYGRTGLRISYVNLVGLMRSTLSPSPRSPAVAPARTVRPASRLRCKYLRAAVKRPDVEPQRHHGAFPRNLRSAASDRARAHHRVQLERRLISQPADSCVYARACTPTAAGRVLFTVDPGQTAPRLLVVLGELVQTTAGKWITHPPTRLPQRAHVSAPASARRASSLPRSRRRAHHMDMPDVRPNGVRAAAEHSLHRFDGPATVRISNIT